MASPPYHRARLVCGSFQSVEAAISSVAAIAVREATRFARRCRRA